MFRASLCPFSGEQDICYCSNIRFVLLKMGIMMPETCWEIVENKHLLHLVGFLSHFTTVLMFDTNTGNRKLLRKVCHSSMAAKRRQNGLDVYWRSYWLDYRGNVLWLPAVEADLSFSKLSNEEVRSIQIFIQRERELYSEAWRWHFEIRRLLQNIGNKLQFNLAPYPRTVPCQSTMHWKPQISQFATRWSLTIRTISTLLISQEGGTSLVGCPWLLIQFIQS